jgi:hypothetical protein
MESPRFIERGEPAHGTGDRTVALNAKVAATLATADGGGQWGKAGLLGVIALFFVSRSCVVATPLRMFCCGRRKGRDVQPGLQF